MITYRKANGRKVGLQPQAFASRASRSLRTLVLTAIVTVHLLLLASRCVAAEIPLRIICIGDSITQGGKTGRPEYTYRLPLQRMLEVAGHEVDFIGTRERGLDSAFKWPRSFDPDHEGFYGKTAREVRKRLTADLPRLAPPDIAIIHLGTNDQGAQDFRHAIALPFTQIVRHLRARNPHVKILIVQIPGIIKNLYMHLTVFRVARELSSEHSPVITIPLYWDWDHEEDTFDGVHPNPNGQEKLAEALFLEIEAILEQ